MSVSKPGFLLDKGSWCLTLQKNIDAHLFKGILCSMCVAVRKHTRCSKQFWRKMVKKQKASFVGHGLVSHQPKASAGRVSPDTDVTTQIKWVIKWCLRWIIFVWCVYTLFFRKISHGIFMPVEMSALHWCQMSWSDDVYTEIFFYFFYFYLGFSNRMQTSQLHTDKNIHWTLQKLQN